MRTSQPRLILILAFLGGCLLFFADMALPQIQFGVLYLVCLIAVYLWGRRQDIYIVAALLSVLLLADSPAGSAATRCSGVWRLPLAFYRAVGDRVAACPAPGLT